MSTRPLTESGLHVHQEVFDGPFDLLIYLVERDKVAIEDIVISDITSSYIESLKQIEDYDPDVASDFIYMAAYLLELKSRALLPRVHRQQLSDHPDPREELIARLVEYKYFKDLAVRLGQLALDRQRPLTRPPGVDGLERVRQLAPMLLDNLYSAYQRALEKARVDVRELGTKPIPVSERMDFIRSCLNKEGVQFSELVQDSGTMEKIATFLALLELVRLGEVSISQQRLFGPITIQMLERDVQ